jgi:hypothetical protein
LHELVSNLLAHQATTPTLSVGVFSGIAFSLAAQQVVEAIGSARRTERYFSGQ